MTNEEFEKELEQISSASDLRTEELRSKAIGYLKLLYEKLSETTTRELIDGVKDKMLRRLYRLSDHKLVGKSIDFEKTFGLDRLEITVVEKAADELHEEGLLDGDKFWTGLTEKGILKAREL